MNTRARRRPNHIVIVSNDDHRTSAVAGALARRLQRPLLDRTRPAEPRPAHGHADVESDGHVADTLAWFARAIETDGESVIAAPTSLLDQIDPPTRSEAVWTILLEDAIERRDPIASDGRLAHRTIAARRLCDISVDTAGHDTDTIVDEIADEWDRVRTTTEAEPHHVR